MVFKRRNEHKLPKFPENVESVFNNLCQALPVEAVEGVKNELDEAVKLILTQGIANARIETKLVNELYAVSCSLLERYETYSKSSQAMVIGAIRYFVFDDDPLPDSGFSSGYYDDVKVMNYVLSKIGEDELIIDI